ncbi:MAG: hypothetical protein AAFV95_12655 [Bacteroidota bacterium]
MQSTKMISLTAIAKTQILSTTEQAVIKGGQRKIGDAIGQSADADGDTR